MTTNEMVLMVIFVGAGFAGLFYFLGRKFKELQKPPDSKSEELMISVINELRRDVQNFSGDSRKEVQNRLDRISAELNRGILHSSTIIERQFKESRTLIQETSERIARFEETNKRVADFAGQLQSLENILRNPKHRGVLGEYYLETMLKNIFNPTQYRMQYKFANGEAVDAAVFYQDKIIPVDSKFSLEGYNRMVNEQDREKKKIYYRDLVTDVKRRIEETSKYIRPKENTFGFAFMFIPSEGVYYDLISSNVGALKETAVDIVEYAHKRNVIIVSPSSFYAYLQTILHGLRAVEMKESMAGIIKKVEQLDKHLRTHEVFFRKVGENLTTTVNSYNKSSKEFAKIDKDVYRVTDGRRGGALQLEELARPESEIE